MKSIISFFFSSIITGSAILALTSCGQPGHGRQLSEFKNPTTADSMLYYFGRMAAGDFLQMAVGDTTLDSDYAREQYLKGIRAGIEAVKENNKSFNEGLLDGVEMGLNIAKFCHDYETELNTDVLLQSMAYALRTDSVLDHEEDQIDFYSVLARLSADKEQKEKTEAMSKLASFGRNNKMHRISPELYGRTRVRGQGKLIPEGTHLAVCVKTTDASGRDLGLTLPGEMTVGDKFIERPFSECLTTMRLGETKVFATPAYVVFGRRAGQMGLDNSDVVMIEIAVMRKLPAPIPD